MKTRIGRLAASAVSALALQLGLPTVAGASVVYSVDDGTSETALGLTGGGDLAWINHFIVTGGQNVIANIQVAWGDRLGSASVSGGQSFRWFVWGDPNADGSPAESALLYQGTGQVDGSLISTDVFQIIGVPDVVVPDSFFVGIAVSHAALNFPAALDQTSFQGQSWVAGSGTPEGFDPLNVSGGVGLFTLRGVAGLDGNWLLRATGAVPEPATVALLGIGLAGLAGTARRKVSR